MSDNPNSESTDSSQDAESTDSSQDAPTEEATRSPSSAGTSRPADLAPDRAGLSWAPAYQGPVTEEVARGTAPVDLSQLEYMQSQLHRRNRAMRMVLTLLLLGALAFNFLVLTQIHDAVLVNVDQARLAQMDLNDLTRARLEALEVKIDRLLESQDQADDTLPVDAAPEQETGETPQDDAQDPEDEPAAP